MRQNCEFASSTSGQWRMITGNGTTEYRCVTSPADNCARTHRLFCLAFSSQKVARLRVFLFNKTPFLKLGFGPIVSVRSAFRVKSSGVARAARDAPF